MKSTGEIQQLHLYFLIIIQLKCESSFIICGIRKYILDTKTSLLKTFSVQYNISTNIELSPYCNAQLLALLKEKQYTVEELNTISYLDLNQSRFDFNNIHSRSLQTLCWRE